MKDKFKKFFLAGIIQGSNKGKDLCSQTYRGKIKAVLKKHFPQAEIVDPIAVHPNSASYDSTKGKKVFYHLIGQAKSCDCIVAYLPYASMGTAIEMWECRKNDIPIWVISPMTENWSIKFLSSEIFDSIEKFEKFVSSMWKVRRS